ncbi:MAG: HAD hydrolase family protein [Candidatus Acidiferrales bacterium]
MVLLASGITCAVDDWLLGPRYGFTKAIKKVGWLKPLEAFANSIQQCFSVVRSTKLARLQAWREKWDSSVIEFCQSAFCGDGANGTADGQLRNLCSALLSAAPRELLKDRTRSPAAYHSQSLALRDTISLAKLFADAFPHRERPILVLGLRTAGSYMAPALSASLRVEGFRNVRSATLRPKRGTTSWEKEEMRRCAAEGGIAIIVDEPAASGGTVANAVNLLCKAGNAAKNIVVLLPNHPRRRHGRWNRSGDVNLSPEITVLLLEAEKWHKTQLLHPASALLRLKEYFYASGYGKVTLTSSPRFEEMAARFKAETPERGHIRFKEIYELELETVRGEVETRYVLAESVGDGWFSYGAFIAAERLAEYVMPVIGLRQGLLFSEWIPKTSQNAVTEIDRKVLVQTLGQYAAKRVQTLKLDEAFECTPDARPVDGALNVVAFALRGVYGHGVLSALKQPRLRREIARHGSFPPTLIDGQVSPENWVANRGRMYTRDYVHNSLGQISPNLTDPAYDLASASLRWNLTPREEKDLLETYQRATGDASAEKRLMRYKLIAGTLEMQIAYEELNDTRMERNYQQCHRRLVAARDFLTWHTTRFLGSLCRRSTHTARQSPVAVLDLDGVLDSFLFGFPSTTAAGIQGVSLLHTHGWSILLNTARSFREVQEYCRSYSFSGGIAEYGGVLWDATGQHTKVMVDQEAMEQLQKVRNALESMPGIYMNPNYDYSIQAYRIEGTRTTSIPASLIEELLDRLNCNRLRFHQSNSDTAVLVAGIDKGTGLQAMFSWLNVSPSNAVAIGDSTPDLPMFRVAGRSYGPAQISCRKEAEALGVRISHLPYQAGFLEIVRNLIHPDGSHCSLCSQATLAWVPGEDPILDLLKKADERTWRKVLDTADTTILDAFRI